MLVPIGATDVSVKTIRAMTAGGQPLPAKVAADFNLYYMRTAVVSLTLHDLATVESVHSDGGIISLDANSGWYRLDMPDAAFEDGVFDVLITGTVAGGVIVSAPINLVNAHAGFGRQYVNHNYGGADTLLVVDPDGSPQGGVLITAFLKVDWDAGNRSVDYSRGQTYTLEDGRWQTGLMLPVGEIVLTFAKTGYHLKNRTITIA